MLAEVYGDILGPGIILKRPNPVLMSNPAVFVATKRCLRKRNQVLVDRDTTNFEPRSHIMSELQVVRPDAPVQAIIRLVGHPHDLIGIPELRYTQDGTEDLVATNLHLASHVGENRRFEKAPLVELWIARPLTTVQQFRSLVNSVLDVAQDDFLTRLGHQGTHLAQFFAPWSNLDRSCLCHQLFDETIID